jgi:hypothetical protein
MGRAEGIRGIKLAVIVKKMTCGDKKDKICES